mgnify:CR=1 FL=1|tara:strand:+ start:31834 stop:32619 length:786 start_codon:yes stop_codon:yes gene_type:complete
MRVVLLTSLSLRHKYIAHMLSKELDLCLIITEEKSSKIESTTNMSSSDATFVTQHFKARQKNEKKFFSSYKDFPDNVEIVNLPHGEINNLETFKLIKKEAPDYIVLFGTSIIKDPIMSAFSNQIINLHLGLSPYYKGSATNLFPIYFNDLAGVGATIHIATNKVDDGPVLHQMRPDIEVGDTIHDIGNRTILKAGKLLPLVINTEKKIAKKFDGKGILCKISDLSVEVLRKSYRNIENELIESYLLNKKKHCSKKPIIECL